MKTTENTSYARAQKRVDDIKKFYRHLQVYIIINVLLLLLKANIMSLGRGGNFTDLHFEHWLDLNVYGTAIVWGVGLLIHGLYVFQYKFKFFKNWEQRKINEFMNQEDENQF